MEPEIDMDELMDEARISVAWDEYPRAYILFRKALDLVSIEEDFELTAEILEGIEDMAAATEEAARELPEIEAAIAENPHSADKRFELGLILSRLGREDEAAAAYDAALKDPQYLHSENYRDTWNNIGWYLFRRHEYHEALKWFERAHQVALADEIYNARSGALALENKILSFCALVMASEAEECTEEYIRRYGRVQWPERRALANLGIDADEFFVHQRLGQPEPASTVM